MSSSTSLADSIDVPYLARLARIAISQEESSLFTGQLKNILAHIEQIKQLDVTGIEPMAHAFSVFDVVREDLVGQSLSKKTVLEQAPCNASGLFIVPKVLE
ncbi:MAG: Asp-tRNA(Asn)/Glu-tRNA(Gln) amidotransferase subunit GatC [Chthoniobacterales bacterium]